MTMEPRSPLIPWKLCLGLGVGLCLCLWCWIGGQPPAFADTALAKQPPLITAVDLGNAAGALQFTPNTLTFKAGSRYKLTLKNDSPVKHYFTAKDFADAIWSQKVDAGNVEIKGAIHDLELRPGSQADWVFIPLRAGTYSLRCTIPGHAEAGMVGTLEIVG